MNNNIPIKQIFSVYEGSALTALFMSDAIIMSGKYQPAGIYGWISSASGALISSVLIKISAETVSKHSNNIISSSLQITLSGIAVFLSLVMFGDFVNSCVLPDIQPFIIPAGILVAGIYSASKNFNTLVKSIHIILPVILFFVIAVSALLIPSARIEYIFTPSNTADISDLLLSSVINTVIFYVKGILIISLYVHESGCHDMQHIKNTAIKGILLYGTLITMIQFLSLAVLGPGLYENLNYPLYYPPGLTFIGEYFERAEILTIVIFMASLIIKSGIYMKIIRNSLKKIRLSV